MSFSSLPTELVRQIIESTIPRTFHSTTYKQRQSTLRSLCLVSRRIRQVAQILLDDAILIGLSSDPTTVNTLLHNEALRQDVRHFAMMDRGWLDRTGEATGRFIRNARQLRTLSLGRDTGPPIVDLLNLASLPNLETLQLAGKNFDLATAIRLPRLINLVFNFDALPIVISLLDPSLLPSLRHLALPMIYGSEDDELLKGSNISTLLPQLQSININWMLTSPLFDECIDQILVDCPSSDFEEFVLRGMPLRHLRMLYLTSTSAAVHRRIRLLTEWIPETPGRIQSLYLDLSLQGTLNLSLEISKAMDRLLECCKDQKIEVVFERQAEEWGVDLAHSEEFCRRQRERKRLEGDQAK